MKKLLLVLIFIGIVGLCEAQTTTATKAAKRKSAKSAKSVPAAQASNAPAAQVSDAPAQSTSASTDEKATPAAVAEETAESPAAQGSETVPSEGDPSVAKDLEQATEPTEQTGEKLETARETAKEESAPKGKKELVVFNSKTRRDPTLSPDDFLLLQYRERQRLAAIEAERQRKLAEERRKQEEAERLRQLELARIKDPTREVRGLITIGGIIGKEVFIGDKVYTIGNKVHGARIVEVTPDKVVFLYKGHKFVKKMQ